MTVLVTGGAGYIGSHMTYALIDAGERVLVLDNLSTGIRDNVSPDAIFVEGEVGDGALVRALIAEHEITAVIHFAGSIVVPELIENPLLYYANNTQASLALVAACVDMGVKRFIFSSTAAVYGLGGGVPIAETDVTDPINPYGRSKLLTEWILRDAAAAHDFRYVVLRYFNVAGADPKGRTGQSTPRATHLIKRAVQVALGRAPQLDIFGTDYETPDGTAIRDYIHVSDLVGIHRMALDYLRENGASETFNCGYGRGSSVLDVVAAVERVTGNRLPSSMQPRRAGISLLDRQFGQAARSLFLAAPSFRPGRHREIRVRLGTKAERLNGSMPVDAKNDVAFRIEPMPPPNALEISWREIEHPSDGNFFTSWSWIGAWLRTLPAEIEPQLIRATRGSTTIGLAVAVFRRLQRHFIVDVRQLHFNSTGDPQYDRIAVEQNDFMGETGLLPAFIGWFRDTGCADELVIPGATVGNVPRTRGLLLSTRPSVAFANDRLDAVARDGIEVVLSRNARQQINRNIRDLSREGALRVEEAATPGDALTYFEALKDLHIRSWTRRGREHAFSGPYFEAFHRVLISSGAGQLLRITAGERVIGYLYNFRADRTVYAYQSGFADEDGRDRPGYVSHALAMDYAAKQGAVRYDFLAGDNRLKRTFGTSEYILCWSVYSRPTPTLRLEAALRSLRNAVRF